MAIHQALITSIYNSPSDPVFTAVPGSVVFSSFLEFWQVPAGVTQVSMVAVGGGGQAGGSVSTDNLSGGGGGGGELRYTNNVSVTPGEILIISVGTPGSGRSETQNGSSGEDSWVARNGSDTYLCYANGGGGGQQLGGAGGAGGSGGIGDGGGNGGNGGAGGNNTCGGAGGGAGGYSGNGGNGGTTNNNTGGSAGTGGGGGGGSSDTPGATGGGGVGLLGKGSSGSHDSVGGDGGGGGSGGDNGGVVLSGIPGDGGNYGGGGGAAEDDTSAAGGAGGDGAVRIIWGIGREFPSTLAGANPFDIQGLGNVSNLTTADLSATFDCSTVATGDSVVFLYMGEDDANAATGQTFSLNVGGSTAGVLGRNNNTAGKARAGIFFVNGSSVAGNSSVSVSITSSNQNGGARSYIAALKIPSRTIDPAESFSRRTESSGANLLQNSFDEESGGGLLISVGYFSNGSNHTLSCDEGDLFTSNGVTTSSGSGNFGFFDSPNNTSFSIDYTRNGTANSQGDVLITASVGFQ